MVKISFLGLVLVLASCTDSRPGGLKNAAVCSAIVSAECRTALRCGEWHSTQQDCVTAHIGDCCDGESCSWPAEATADDKNVCVATINGAACEDFDLDYGIDGDQCDHLLSEYPPDDGDDDVASGDDSASDDDSVSDDDSSADDEPYARFETCWSDDECNEPLESCFEAPSPNYVGDAAYYNARLSVCTSSCTTSFDCKVDETCVDLQALYQTTHPDEDFSTICLKLCSDWSDCPSGFVCQSVNPSRYSLKACFP